MSKRHRNAPGPGHYKVQGHPVEDNDVASMSKQALVRDAARRKRRAVRKKAAPSRAQRAAGPKRAELPPTPQALERAHDREFAKMNERKAPKRVKPSAPSPQPGYFSATARGVIRGVARVALAPLSLARAVVDRFRDRD